MNSELPPDPLVARRRARRTLLLVVLAFVLPIGIAWWMALGHLPHEQALLNHGTLLRPPLDIRSDARLAPLAGVALGPGEWALTYYAAGPCEAACAERLTLLTTLRSLLGHDGTRVKVVALVDGGAVDVPLVTPLVDAAARSRLAELIAPGLSAGGADSGIAFLDWRHQLMLHFPTDAPPGDVKADLKRLLKGSKIR